MLAGVFTLLFATTTPAEFTLALENLRLPYRYAFSLGLAFQSLTLLEEEWNGILEAQRSRGALRPSGNWRDSLRQVPDLVALTVPAVVMTTKRAWSITEAAYARGFDSPHRTSYRRLQLTRLDILAMMVALLTSLIFLFWPVIFSFLEHAL
jgi:energy-coupling factor transporter transmembrane protein EcfT